MRPQLVLSVALTGIVLTVAACGGSYGGSVSGVGVGAPTAAPATIGVSKVDLGQVLVDQAGKTLYLFEADTGTQSTCSTACAQVWPPLTTTGAPAVTGGAMQSLLGTTTRADGTTQVTYHRHPLYYYASDTKPRDVPGPGVHSL